MALSLLLQEHKLASICAACAVLLSAVIIAFIVLESIATWADVNGKASFEAITNSFTQRIESAFNASLLQMEDHRKPVLGV